MVPLTGSTHLAAAGTAAPGARAGASTATAQPGSELLGSQGRQGWEIDSLFQALFIIPSTDTDMCLLKGDTVPLTLTLSALVIWDASPGSSGVTFWGEGRDCIYL